jgi:hypothetical protein
MKQATQWILGLFAVGLLATAVVHLLQIFTGERAESYAIPCVLALASFGCGSFAWFFETEASTESCEAETDGEDTEIAAETAGGDAA